MGGALGIVYCGCVMVGGALGIVDCGCVTLGGAPLGIRIFPGWLIKSCPGRVGKFPNDPPGSWGARLVVAGGVVEWYGLSE